MSTEVHLVWIDDFYYEVAFLKESLAKSSILLVNFCLNFQFSNALRIIEMVPVLKKFKVWTLYVHIVASS